MADFASQYGVRLMGSRMPWPEFAWLVGGLFSVDSRLRRLFVPPESEDNKPDDIEEG